MSRYIIVNSEGKAVSSYFWSRQKLDGKKLIIEDQLCWIFKE